MILLHISVKILYNGLKFIAYHVSTHIPHFLLILLSCIDVLYLYIANIETDYKYTATCT